MERKLLEPNTLFHGRYHVVRCLGVGGMGAVYEVIHLATQRRRALKTLLPELLLNPDMRARFKLEMTITAEIESEHIVEVFDAGVDDATGLPFLVMEYLRGESLAVILRKHERLPAEDLMPLMHQASLALERTHAAGVVHRDLKPENLFVTRRDDGSPRLKVLDFGIAKVMTQTTYANTTRSFGTPLYMSPEQVRGDGDIDGRSDIYALGQIVFTALVGHAFWAPETENSQGPYAVLLKVAAGAHDPASVRALRYGIALPNGFDAWFSRATNPVVCERFESVAELVEQLAKTLGLSVPRAQRGDGLFVDIETDAPADAVPQVATLVGVCDSGKANATPTARVGTARRARTVAQLATAGVFALAVLGSLVGIALRRSMHLGPNPSAWARLGAAPPAPSARTSAQTLGSLAATEAPTTAAPLQEASGRVGLVTRSDAKSSADRAGPSAAKRSEAGSRSVKSVQPAGSSGRLSYDPSDLR